MEKQKVIINVYKIFNYYKNKYSLKTKMRFEQMKTDSRATSYFTFPKNTITLVPFITSDKIDALTLTVLVEGTDLHFNIKTANIFVLLHEIKHAIDYTKNKKSFVKKVHEINSVLDVYKKTTMPLEKMANKFATKELKKWVK